MISFQFQKPLRIIYCRRNAHHYFILRASCHKINTINSVLGCKWSLQQLRCYLQQTVGSDWLLWQNISTMIVLTIVSQLSKVPNTVNCFEFYGFDILIDSELKPWLIEVSVSNTYKF